MEIDYKALGHRVQSIRKEQHLTQSQAAEKIEISENHLAHIETCSTKLGLRTLVI